jgi:hypothetical protein
MSYPEKEIAAADTQFKVEEAFVLLKNLECV